MKNYCDFYGYTPDKEAIQRTLEMMSKSLESAATPEVLMQCFSLKDLTSLHNTDTVESVTRLVEKVNLCREQKPEYPLPASICVFPV